MTDETENRTETEKRRMSPLARRRLILFLLFVVALLVIDATRPPSPESWSWVWIGKKLWKMPGGIGALVGTLFGLIGGFATLIRAQKHQAYLARELQKKQWQETHKLADLAREREREMIYRAIAADLDALLPSLTGFRDALEEANQVNGLNPGKNVFHAMRHVIWESCAPKIGLLDPNHAASIVETYRFIDALVGRVAALDLDIKDHRNDLLHLTNELIKNIGEVLKNLQGQPDRPSAGSQ